MNEEKQIIEEESRGLTFKDILFIIRKHWIAIVCFILCGAGIGLTIALVEVPTYQSTGTMLVSYESTSQNLTQDYTFSNYISNTFVVFLKENIVLDKVSERTDISVQELRDNLSVSNTALVIKVSYTNHDPEEARRVVDVVINTAQEVADTTEKVLNEEGVLVDKPVYHLLYDNLKVFSPPKAGTRVSHVLRNTAIGFGAGVGVAFLYVLIRQMFDNTFKSSDEIERILNIPVLAGIPEYQFDDEKKSGKKGGKKR